MHETTCLPVLCDLTVFGDNEKKRQKAVLRELQSKVKSVEELSEGFSLNLVAEPYMLQLVAEMIAFESRCCPFLVFVLEVKNGGRSITLNLTGGEGAKDFLRAELGLES